MRVIIRLIKVEHHQIGRRIFVLDPRQNHIDAPRPRHPLLQCLRERARCIRIREITSRPHHASRMLSTELVLCPNRQYGRILMEQVIAVRQCSFHRVIHFIAKHAVGASEQTGANAEMIDERFRRENWPQKFRMRATYAHHLHRWCDMAIEKCIAKAVQRNDYENRFRGRLTFAPRKCAQYQRSTEHDCSEHCLARIATRIIAL